MNRMITTLLVLGAMGAGMQAMADDPSTSTSSGTTMNTHQMMKHCMAKAKASNNGMSEQDMKKSCKDQIKAKVDHPNDTAQPVTPAH
ncbi:MAG TPA: hypothetical protein VGL87_07980 [Steroidobacteraceae bacterium]